MGYAFTLFAFLENYTCLRPDNADISSFFDISVQEASTEENQINVSELKSVLNTMDTEFDRKCLRYVLSSVRCCSEIHELGFDPHNVKTVQDDMQGYLKKWMQLMWKPVVMSPLV